MAMPTGNTPERRRRNRNHRAPPVEVKFRPLDGSAAGWLSAVLVDAADAGLGAQSRAPLAIGTQVLIEPSQEMIDTLGSTPSRGRVAWCRRTNSGLFRFGVAYAQKEAPQQEKPETGQPSPEPIPDYYELLQVHPKATADMVNRAYRLLAQIYHPDNAATGDTEKFRQLTAAYKTLSDETARAAYDVTRNANVQTIWSVFKGSAPRTGMAAERRKRHGILAALFQKRAADPHAPAMSIFELEDVLSVSREQIEFTLWYLRESTFVVRSDDNKFQITVQGVDGLEAMEHAAGPDARYFHDRELIMLPAPTPRNS
jgi:curved DNA-binding protein